jgi:hypothetical protein
MKKRERWGLLPEAVKVARDAAGAKPADVAQDIIEAELIKACAEGKIRSRLLAHGPAHVFSSHPPLRELIRPLPPEVWSGASIVGNEVVTPLWHKPLVRVGFSLDDVLSYLSESPTPPIAVPSGTGFRRATDRMLHAEIGAAYDDAERNGEKPPNLKELPELVSRRLRDKGFQATQREIRRIGQKPEFAGRRGLSGISVASERKQSSGGR